MFGFKIRISTPTTFFDPDVGLSLVQCNSFCKFFFCSPPRFVFICDLPPILICCHLKVIIFSSLNLLTAICRNKFFLRRFFHVFTCAPFLFRSKLVSDDSFALISFLNLHFLSIFSIFSVRVCFHTSKFNRFIDRQLAHFDKPQGFLTKFCFPILRLSFLVLVYLAVCGCEATRIFLQSKWFLLFWWLFPRALWEYIMYMQCILCILPPSDTVWAETYRLHGQIFSHSSNPPAPRPCPFLCESFFPSTTNCARICLPMHQTIASSFLTLCWHWG